MGTQQSTMEKIVSMATTTEFKIAIATFAISLVTFKAIKYARSNSPPGPWGFPIIGHLPLFGSDPTVTFDKWRKKHGDVFSIRMGSWPTVIVNGRKAIREALQGDSCSGRPQFYTTTLLDGPSVSFGDFTHDTIRHRKLARTILTSFTNAKKNPIEDILQREVDTLLEIFASTKETPFNPHDQALLGAGSIIYQVCYGRNENIREKKDFIDFILRSNEFVEFVGAGNPVDVLPSLRFVMPWAVTPIKEILGASIEQRKIKVNEHLETFDPDNLRDVTDGVINVVQSGGDDVNLLSDKRIYATIDDFFGAGFGTVAGTMEWAIFLMSNNRLVQARIQEEIDNVIGMSRRPSLEDRGKMTYTEATINEIMRFSSLAPLGIPHLTTADTQMCGYDVEKGTVVFINLFSMARDPEVWGDPEVFRPERFIDPSGNMKTSLMDEFLPFGTGRRKCIGEHLARVEVFLFFAGLLQRCSFIKPAGSVTDPGVNFTLTRLPKAFEVKVVIRS